MGAALAGRGAEVEVVTPRSLSIAPCAGCFGCWTRTPGECVIDDDARPVVRSWIAANLVAYVSPVTFGGYSSELKKLLDRIILSVLDPRFAVVGGEVHHRLRYGRYPVMIALGTLPAPDPEAGRLFARLAARNGLNIHAGAEAELLVSIADEAGARLGAERLLDRVWARL